MCGIVGYTGKKGAQDILIEGLAKLEYRGYDSAGIALLSDTNDIVLTKTAGKVADLQALCTPNSYSCGIGHTRWATHGGVTDTNAHPHHIGSVALIHNGIVENYHELIEEYHLEDRLVSETDTEVVAALLDTLYEGSPKETIKKAVSVIKGSFAFCIMFEDKPGVIYAVRNVSPMVAAHCAEGSFVASDLTALISYTKDYFIVPEYHILTITGDAIMMEDMEGSPVEPEMLTVNWDISSAQKEGYPYFMLKEIYEQPAALRNTIMPRITDGLPDFSGDDIPDSLFEGVRKITVIACGTAMHSGMVAKTMIHSLLNIPVEVAIASEFRYETPIIDENTLVVAISQSGETIDTLEALRLAKKYTRRTLSIVNVKGSTIARESDYVLYTHAGPEIAVASTKAYTVQIAAQYLMGCRLGIVTGLLPERDAKEFVENLLAVIPAIEKTLEMADSIQELTGTMTTATDTFFIGRGLDYTLSMEGALKLKEISYIHAEAYAAGELKHGTIALISEHVPVIAIATQKHVYSKVISNIREVKARGAYVVLISKDKKITDKTVCDVHVSLPDIPDLFTVFETAVILQLIAYHTSDGKGLNVDQPRNLAKSVTVE